MVAWEEKGKRGRGDGVEDGRRKKGNGQGRPAMVKDVRQSK